MKNKLQQIKQTWTYNHKLLIITLALALAHVWPVYIAPHMPTMPTYAATETYYPPQPTATTTLTIEGELEKRTTEIYEKLTPVFKERARQIAIEYMAHELGQLSQNSPHVDLQAIAEQYGVE